jgi:hypothetical protein
MMNKKNRKQSPNKLICNVTYASRISNKTYLANKADKFNISVDAFKLYYLSKDGYAQVVAEVEAGGLDKAAEVFKVEKKTIISYLRYNGRGKFVKQDKPNGRIDGVGKEVVEEKELVTV